MGNRGIYLGQNCVVSMKNNLDAETNYQLFNYVLHDFKQI